MNDERDPNLGGEGPPENDPRAAEEPTREAETEPQPAAREEPAQGRRGRRLLRSRDDRMIAGVAGGLGEYFAVDPMIVRLGFFLSLFFGGLGALAYVALWLLVPSAPAGDGDDDAEGKAPIERSRGLAIAAAVGLGIVLLSWGFFDWGWWWHDGPWVVGPPIVLIAIGVGLYLLLRQSGNRSLAGVVGTIVIAIAAISAAGFAAMFSAWAGATGHGVAVAAVIVAIGVMLVLAAFRGGARWLIAPAAVLAVPLAFVAAADISFGDGVGQREYDPVTAESIPADGYELGVGRLEVDLRGLDWGPDTVVETSVDVGVGEALVAVPENVCVVGELESGIGVVNLVGSTSEGFDAGVTRDADPAATPRLEITGDADLGVVRVVNDDDRALDVRGHRWDGDEPANRMLEERAEQACEVTAAEGPDTADERGGAGADREPRSRGGRAGSGGGSG